MTSNRDWLMRLAHDAPDELAAWMDAEHETNGIGGGTNGIGDGITLPDGDAVVILRKAASYDGDYSSSSEALRRLTDSTTVYFALETLADMVDRDYVSREAYDYAHREFNQMNEERREAFAERDEWKAKCERQSEAIGEWELRCERLESECDGYEGIVDALTQQIGELKAKAKAKSDKRAAAAERLRNCFYTSDSDLMRAMLNWGHEPHTGDDSRFALIDLLADDDDCGHSADMSQKDGDCVRSEPGMSENLGSDLGTSEVFDGKGSKVDSREKLKADVHQYANPEGDKSTIGALWEKKMLGFLDRQEAITERECCEYEDALREQHHKRIAELQAEIAKRDKGIERLKKRRDELEAEVERLRAELNTAESDNEYLRGTGRKPTDAVREFVERYEQRIEELERLWHSFENEVAAQSVEIAERDKRIAELEDELRKFKDMNNEVNAECAELEDELHRSYDAQTAKAEVLTLRAVRIAELEAERDEWHEKAAELEIELAQVRGNLKNVTHNYAIAKAKCEGREQSAIQRERRADEKMAEAERAIAEPPEERTRELIARLESERDGWRMRCGKLLDAAHGMQGIADEWDEEV